MDVWWVWILLVGLVWWVVGEGGMGVGGERNGSRW